MPVWWGKCTTLSLQTGMDTNNYTCYPHYANPNTVKGRLKIILLTLTDKLRWLPLAIYLSMATLLLTSCGSESPAPDSPTIRKTSTPMVSATGTDTQQPTSPPTEVSVEIGHEVGQKAPNFMLTTVEGEQVTLDSFQGRPLILYFFATW